MTLRHRSEIRVAIDGPADDESLSSLLDRSASFWGVDRSAMVAALEFGPADDDPDAPSQAALHTLSLVTGFSAARLDMHRTASDVCWLFPEQRIGYCPCCWAEDAARGRAPYFRRAWAACTAVACDCHGCLLYAWDVDARGCRRPPPPGRSARLNAQWRADLTHAERALDRRGLETLTGFAAQAHVAIERGDAWPSNWRGDAAAGRALTQLLTTNPAPFPERLLMDRLVWLFPPEEILAHPEYALTPAVSFVRDAIRRLEILPVPYVQTLLAVGAVLLPEADQVKIPPFLHEPLSDALPKERIYEIWEPQHQGNHQDQVAAYNQTLRNLVMTLMKVTIWVQRQYKGQLTADAPPLELMKLPNYRGVSVDGQLLILHAKLEQQIEATSNKVGYGCDADELEAGYRSIRLTHRLNGVEEQLVLAEYGLTDEADLRVYAVTETSCNSKLKTGDSVTFFLNAEPGILNQRASKYLSGAHDDLGNRKYIAMAAGLQGDIRHFDRVGGRVVVAPGYYAAVTNALVEDGLNLDANCSLVEAPPFSEGAYRKEQFIRRLGNPAIAYPHSQALTALGKQAAAPPKPSKEAPTRGACVLWDAPNVAIQDSDWSAAEISAAIDWLRDQGHPINPSQEEAIRAGLGRCLSLIWGPPGTGKTTTGAGIAAAELWLAITRQVPQKLLITGPNYQAIENFYTDLLPLFLALGPDACRVRWIERREAGDPEVEAKLDYRRSEKGALSDLREEMREGDKPTIVFAVTAQLFNLANLPSRYGKKSDAVPALELFDLVMVDEASQVDVASAIGALAELAPSGRLVLLGDHLQMPPIARVEPPKGCEHIVGSILDYFQVRFSEIEPQPLLENYRSAEGLVRFARELGYPAKLTAKFPHSQLALASPVMQPVDWPEAFPWSELFPALLAPPLSTLAVTYADGKAGQANEFEASLVVATVVLARKSLLRGLAGRTSPPTPGLDADHFWTETIGVVTPHRAQRAAVIRGLRKAFPMEEGALIEKAVDTVERFQGGERDLILVSFGVGDPDVIEAEEEFLLGLNRTNVAISRARAKAIVFVSDDLSYHLPDDADVVRTARAIKGFVHQYCDQTQRFEVPAGDGVRSVTLRWRS